MDSEQTSYCVRQCSKCPGDTKYYCKSCPCVLCLKCKEGHVHDLNTIDHDVVIYCKQFDFKSKQEICEKHPHKAIKIYCELCDVPVCDFCFKHNFLKYLWTLRKFKCLSIGEVYKSKIQKHRKTIHTIRSEVLLYRHSILEEIKTNIRTFYTEFSPEGMSSKVQKLTDQIDNVLHDFDYKHRCLKEQLKMKRRLARLQRYEYLIEQSAIRPLQYILFRKTNRRCIQDSPHAACKDHTSQLSIAESISMKDMHHVMKLLIRFNIKNKEKSLEGNESLLTLMPFPELHKSLTVTDVDNCCHISGVTSDLVWISDYSLNLVMTNTKGDTLNFPERLCIDSNTQIHTVNGEDELIYIDTVHNINKLSHNSEKSTIFIRRVNSTWKPRCVHWSPSTGDLLVGMHEKDTKTGKITRYNKTGQLTHTIQLDNTGQKLYTFPCYITENNNGDVVVSNSFNTGVVVVTERGGRHRFSYEGHPPSSHFRPRGICTDTLSHILVCDCATSTLQMIDKNGQFLSYLLIRPSGLFIPQSLYYDVDTHRLWVGSKNRNKIFIYKYFTRPNVLTDRVPVTADVMEPCRKIQINIEKKRQLQLSSCTQLHKSFTVRDIKACRHISCMTSDTVLISDFENNLILTNTIGKTLKHPSRTDLCYGNGVHAVNSKHELFYIDRGYNIDKVANGLKTTTRFIERIKSTWRPQCVYVSPITEDILVGIFSKDTKTGHVARFNKNGQSTQKIQHDNTEQELYLSPRFITENKNGDVVVSDSYDLSYAVVVTDRGGRHRFSYTGHPPGSRFYPGGICSDSLSNILVCDGSSETVHILDKDGQFLFNIKLQEIDHPGSISFDAENQRLWIGSHSNNKVAVYKYLTNNVF